MKKYDPRYKLTRWDVEHIAFGIYRYCLTINDVRDLLGGVARETAYAHVRRWIDLGYAYRKGGYILFAKTAYWHCGIPFPYINLGMQNLPHYANTTLFERFIRYRGDMILMDWEGERLQRHKRGLHQTFEYDNGQTHVPDAVAEIYFKDTAETWKIAIELEQSYKGPGRTDDILAILASQYEHVWYVCPPAIYHLVERRIGALPKDDIPKFEMWELDTIQEWQGTQYYSRITQRLTSEDSEEEVFSSPLASLISASTFDA